MKFIAATFFLSLASCCAFGQDKAAVSAAEAACGPSDLDFSVTADESRHPTPIPDSGKALIYVVQNAPGGTRVGADGKWLGASKRGTYFSASVDRGEHHLNTRAHIGLWSHLEKPATQAVRFFLHEMRLLAVDLDNALLVRTRWLGSLTVTP
jgi:hypothetical protein